MRIGDVVKVSDLDIAKNPNIELLTDPEAFVVGITEPRTKAEETETEENEETAE